MPEGVIIRVGLDGVNVSRSLTNLKNIVRSSTNQMKAEMAVFDAAGDNIGKLNTKYKGLGRTIKAQSLVIEKLSTEYNKLKATGNENSDAALKYAYQINDLTKKQALLQKQMGLVNKELITTTSRLSVLGRASNSFDKITQGAKKASDSLANLGHKATIGVTVPVVGVVGAGLKSYLGFNQELTTMKSLLNDGTVNAAKLNQEITNLGQHTQNWAKQYGQSTSDINNGMETLIKRGYTYNQVLGAMPSYLNAARASGDDFSTVMDIASSTLEQFNLKASDTATMTKNTQRVTDTLSYVANKTAASFDTMGTAMEYVGPVAHSVGYSLEDTASAIGLLSNNGIEADKAGTALRGAISRMLKPTNQSAAAFKDMGLSVKKMKDGFYTLPDLLDTINKNTQGMTKAEKAHLIAVGFGVQAQTGMNILLNQGGDALRKLSSETQKATGYTKKLSDQMGTSAQTQVNKLKSSLQVLGQDIGKDVLPQILPLIKEADNLIKEFDKLSESQKHAIIDAGLFAAAIGPVSLALSAVLKPIMLLSGGLKLASSGLLKYRTAAMLAGTASKVEMAGGLAAGAEEAGALGGSLGLLANPIGLTIGAVGLLGVAGYTLYKGFTDVSTANKEVAKVSLKTVDSMMQQYNANGKMINQLSQLRNKTKLSNAEFSRLVDLNKAIQDTTNPKKLNDYQQEFDDLRKKSGLSNQQLATMLDLNSKLTKKMPEATKQITTQGNRIADTTNNLKKYNQQLADSTLRELDKQLNNALANQKDNQQKINSLSQKYQSGLKEETRLKSKIADYNTGEIQAEITKNEKILKNNKATDVQKLKAAATISLDKQGLDLLHKSLAEQEQKDNKLNSQITKLKTQNSQIDTIYNKMKQMVFEENGLNYQKGRGVKYLDQQLQKIEAQKKHLEDNTSSQKKSSDEYQNQIGKLNSQIKKLEDVKSQLIEISKEAGKPVTKKVTVQVNTTQIDASGNKYSVMGQLRAYRALKGYATGTNNYPGGYAIVGENGPEIVKLPKGSQITPTDKSLQMIHSLTTSTKAVSMMHKAIGSQNGNAKLEQLQAQNNQLVALLIQTLENKQFNISNKQIYDANKAYDKQYKQALNLAKGVLVNG